MAPQLKFAAVCALLGLAVTVASSEALEGSSGVFLASTASVFGQSNVRKLLHDQPMECKTAEGKFGPHGIYKDCKQITASQATDLPTLAHKYGIDVTDLRVLNVQITDDKVEKGDIVVIPVRK